jgi:hypothetical protein
MVEHRDMQTYLEDLILAQNDEAARVRIENRLKFKLYDPGVIERSELLSDNHPLKREAFRVMDALDAVTNGMYDQDALQGLDGIVEASIFSPWKHAVLAIKALYDQDESVLGTELEAIPDGSAPAALKPLIWRLAESKSDLPAGRAAAELSAQIIKESGEIALARQIEESLEARQEEVTADLVAIFVKDLSGQRPDAARQCALWAVDSFRLKDFDSSLLEEHLRFIFGEAEFHRLAALSWKDTSPERALAYWGRYYLASTWDTEAEEFAAFLDIALSWARLISEADQAKLVPLFSEVIAAAGARLDLEFKNRSRSGDLEDTLCRTLEQLGEPSGGLKSQTDIGQLVVRPEARVPRRAIVQLELFPM